MTVRMDIANSQISVLYHLRDGLAGELPFLPPDQDGARSIYSP